VAQDFTARGKTLDAIAQAIESEEFAARYGGKSTLMLEAAIAAAAQRAADESAAIQARWAKIATLAAVGSCLAATAAVIVAAVHG
jgi:hypothetical protein